MHSGGLPCFIWTVFFRSLLLSRSQPARNLQDLAGFLHKSHGTKAMTGACQFPCLAGFPPLGFQQARQPHERVFPSALDEKQTSPNDPRKEGGVFWGRGSKTQPISHCCVCQCFTPRAYLAGAPPRRTRDGVFHTPLSFHHCLCPDG